MNNNEQRDELARDIFVADNHQDPNAANEWEAFKDIGGVCGADYAHNIADRLYAAGYRKLNPADRGEAPPPTVLLEVLPDSPRGRSDRVAIVTDHELPNLAGHLREDDEAHAGRWAYPFSRHAAALGAARRLVDENPGTYALAEGGAA